MHDVFRADVAPRAWSELRLARKGLFARHPLIRTIVSFAGAGGSTLMTWAPNSASKREAKGAAIKLPSSITFIPVSGLSSGASFASMIKRECIMRCRPVDCRIHIAAAPT